jgi:hypothetical protein
MLLLLLLMLLLLMMMMMMMMMKVMKMVMMMTHSDPANHPTCGYTLLMLSAQLQDLLTSRRLQHRCPSARMYCINDVRWLFRMRIYVYQAGSISFRFSKSAWVNNKIHPKD